MVQTIINIMYAVMYLFCLSGSISLDLFCKYILNTTQQEVGHISLEGLCSAHVLKVSD